MFTNSLPCWKFDVPKNGFRLGVVIRADEISILIQTTTSLDEIKKDIVDVGLLKNTAGSGKKSSKRRRPRTKKKGEAQPYPYHAVT
jgi:hypothetical protein